MLKKPKKKTTKQLKKQLWTVFSQYIRLRDKGVCISCGKKDNWRNMDAGHYIPKSNGSAGMSTYFDTANVNCQCTRCNRFLHGNLSQYALALKKKHGDSILEDLENIRMMYVKYTSDVYESLITTYKQKVEKLLQEQDMDSM